MSRLAKIDFAPGRTVIAGAPAGLAALVVGELAAAAPAGILHVARDDAGMARMAEALAFFAPQCSVLTFPAWDCLPYDRVSPNPAIAARRLEALTRIADAEPGQVLRGICCARQFGAKAQWMACAYRDGPFNRAETGQIVHSDHPQNLTTATFARGSSGFRTA